MNTLFELKEDKLLKTYIVVQNKNNGEYYGKNGYSVKDIKKAKRYKNEAIARNAILVAGGKSNLKDCRFVEYKER